MHLFHIATRADWEAARRRGSYTTSTLGRTLDEEGFLHASRREQVGPTFQRFYAGVREPLVLLTIDAERLSSPWREDPVGDDTFPHIYGPLNPDAVIRVQELDARGGTGGFTSLFLREMGWRMGLALVAMLLAGAGAWAGARTGAEWGRFGGALTGLAVGAAISYAVVRRRR